MPGKEPQHWRLVRRYRAGTRIFSRLVAVVGAGEWTTAGDVSIAARGDVRAAEVIGRASLSHRVVLSGAALDDAARERLAAEGVAFLDDRQPDPRQRVNWDTLTRRVGLTQDRRRSVRTAALNYLQIPALDLEESIAFYEEALGWKITRHPSVGVVLDQTGYPEFVDSTGHVGGGFVLGRPPSREPGLMPVIAVDSIADVLAAVVAQGGEILKPRTPIVAGEDWEATFRDPAGNAFGLYEHHGS